MLRVRNLIKTDAKIMSNRDKILDNIARVAGGAVSLVSDAKSTVKSVARAQIDDIAQNMDLVSREEFEKLELMLIAAREDQKALEDKVTALEALLKDKTKR